MWSGLQQASSIKAFDSTPLYDLNRYEFGRAFSHQSPTSATPTLCGSQKREKILLRHQPARHDFDDLQRLLVDVHVRRGDTIGQDDHDEAAEEGTARRKQHAHSGLDAGQLCIDLLEAEESPPLRFKKNASKVCLATT